jgi:hypothetical protein
LVSDVSEFIKANPRTKYLLDIITSVGGIKSALSAKSGSRLKDKLAELENLMAGIKPFGLFLESRAAKRQKAALRELAETKQLLNSEIDFLRQFVVQNFVSRTALVETIVPVLKEVEVEEGSSDLKVVKQRLSRLNHFIRSQKPLRHARAKFETARKTQLAQKRKAEVAQKQTAAAQLKARLAGASRAKIEARRRLHKYSVTVIIGNKNYEFNTPEVSFAHNDADAFKKYLLETVGYRVGNIIDLRDASQAQLLAVFGTDSNYEGKLYSYIRPGKSDVTVFYSGHGVPGLKDRRGYLLPVDADPNLVEINGYPVDLLFKNLSKIGSRSTRVYLDACFSGDSPKGMLIRAASGLSITPVQPKAMGSMVTITAAKGAARLTNEVQFLYDRELQWAQTIVSSI